MHDSILGIRLDVLTKNQSIDLLVKWLNQAYSKCNMVVTVNPEMVMAAQKNEDLKYAINDADLCLADGFGIIWAAKNTKQSLLEKIPGVDLVESLALLSPQNNWRWYLLGGKPGVAKEARLALEKKYPNIIVVEAEDGGVISPKDTAHQEELVNRINSANPDILLVALGVPKQELFLHNNREILNAKIGIGVGGTLDFISGKQKRAPKIIRNLNLEWAWRLIMEPKRFKRILTATVIFPLTVIFRKNKAQNDPKPLR